MIKPRTKKEKSHMERTSIWDKEIERKSPGFLPEESPQLTYFVSKICAAFKEYDGRNTLNDDAELVKRVSGIVARFAKEETERADSNFASCERVKGKLSAACNAHEALVDALRAATLFINHRNCMGESERFPDVCACGALQVNAKCRAALSLATEQK